MDGLFLVSSLGRIFSKRSGRILRPTISKKGYHTICTRVGGRGGKSVAKRIHRLVAMAFIPNSDCKPDVNHIDGNKWNNSVSNLEWVTSSENNLHAYQLGLNIKRAGIKNPAAKLTLDDIRFIRGSILSGGEISKLLGVSRSTINRCRSRLCYKP